MGLNAFVLVENKGDCNLTFLCSLLVKSIPSPYLMQRVLSLNRKVVPGLQCQQLGTPLQQVSCESVQLLHSIAFLIAGFRLSETIALQFLGLDEVTFAVPLMGVMWLGRRILGRANTYKLMSGEHKEMISLEYLPPQLLKLTSKSGTCFSGFLCLSFHNTNCNCIVYPQALTKMLM